MSINLADYEKGLSLEGDYDDALKDAQKRLARAHFRHIIHRRRSMIVFEGWDASGKGGIIRRMTAEWEPRYFDVHPIGAPSEAEKERHFLWRFWQRLPAARQIAVFDRSWYGRVLVERVEGLCSQKEWQRGYDIINEFEAQHIDCGTNLIKIFLHISQDSQDKRLAARLDNPEKRWKITEEDFRNRSRRSAYLDAMHEMFRETSTRWAPWSVFDANHKKAARIAVLNHIADQLDKLLPNELPEADPELLVMARKAFGYKG